MKIFWPRFFVCFILLSPAAFGAQQCLAPDFASKAIEQIEAGSALADLVEYNHKSKNATLIGRVLVASAGWRIEADRAAIDGAEQKIHLNDNVRAQSDGIQLRAQALNRDGLQFEALQSDFVIDTGEQLQGRASQLRSSPEQFIVKDTVLTTCTLLEQKQPTWAIVAEEIDINRDSGQAIARSVRVQIAGQTIARLPWLRFNVSGERSSGFLTPTLRYSSETGIGVSVPWYWNIAPHTDVTFSPLLHSKQQALDWQWRYLSVFGLSEIEGNRSEQGDAQRLRHRFRHKAFRGSIDWSWLPQPDYFDRALSQHSLSSADYAPRQAELIYEAPQWSSGVQWSDDTPLSSKSKFDYLPRSFIRLKPTLFNNWSLEALSSAEKLRAANALEGKRLLGYARLSHRLSKHNIHWKNRIDITLNRQQWDDIDDDLRSNRISYSSRLESDFNGEKWQFTPRIQWQNSNQGGDDLRRIDDARLGLSYNNFFEHSPYSNNNILPDGSNVKFGFNYRYDFSNTVRMTSYAAISKSQRDNTISTQGFGELPDQIIGTTVDFNQRFKLDLSVQNNSLNDNGRQNSIALNYTGVKADLGIKSTQGDTLNQEQWLSGKYRFDNGFAVGLVHHRKDNSARDNDQTLSLDYENCCSKFGVFYKREETNLEQDWQLGLRVVLKGFGANSHSIDSNELE